MGNYENASQSDLAYIKAVMTRSEVASRCFSKYFVFMTIYTLVAAIVLALLRADIYADDALTGNLSHDVFINCVAECAWKAISLIPVLIFTVLYRNKVKSSNMGISVWLYSVIAFVNVFCGFLLPFVAVAITASYEISDIFLVFTSALIMFIVGVFTDGKKLTVFSVIYFLIPVFMLSAVGFCVTYSEYNNETVNAVQALLFGLCKTVFYSVWPATGYLILAVYMKKRIAKPYEH